MWTACRRRRLRPHSRLLRCCRRRARPLAPAVGRPSGSVLVSLFGGIEAGRRALDLLGVQVLQHISAEIASPAVRAASLGVLP